MGYEEDFTDEQPVEIEIKGRKFKYKPTTGGDENNWLKDVMMINPETKITSIDYGEYNKKKLENITSVPYDNIIINKIIGQDKKWSELNTEERYKVLSRLKPGIFDKLINAMKKIDEIDIKSIKN